MPASAPQQAEQHATTTRKAVLYDSHVHTHFCRHASGDMEEYAMEAFMGNLRGLIFTCHGPLPIEWANSVRMLPEELPHYLDAIETVRLAWASLIDIRFGLECDYIPHHPQVIESVIESLELDYLLGSVHPQFNEYWDHYYDGDDGHFQRLYFDHLAEAAESGYFDAISHPDLVRELFPRQWSLSRQMPHIQKTLDRIAATGVAIELNTASMHRDFRETSPGPQMLREMHQRKIPVVLGSDAHNAERVGDAFRHALKLLQDTGYRELHYFLDRQPHVLALDDAIQSLPAGIS